MAYADDLRGPLPLLSSMDSSPNIVANWDDVVCPICLESPHNAVLLQCSSLDNGCRPFICDTGETHSNCLNRFKAAQEEKPKCPLCRGDVIGSIIVDEARAHLNSKLRCCEEKHCAFSGDYASLQEHTLIIHPHSRPSEIDPARKIYWDQFQQSLEIIDVISTIHSEIPHGVVLGDYVIEYGHDDDGGDEYEDFPGDDGHWWTSCILYNVFDNFRSSRNRRRSRRGSRRSGFDQTTEEGSSSSPDTSDLRVDEGDEEFRRGSSHGSSRRRRSRFNDQ